MVGLVENMTLYNDYMAGIGQDKYKLAQEPIRTQEQPIISDDSALQSVVLSNQNLGSGRFGGRHQANDTTRGATTLLVPIITAETEKEIPNAKNIVESSLTEEMIEDEAYDPIMVAEYGDEIFSYMKELETKMIPDAHYMENQAELQWPMRSILIDWLIQVHDRLSLLPETLFLCVNYIDRFLSCKVISLGKLQLVGAAAIFIAAKYEDINHPLVGEIVDMVDGGYTVDEILKAERFMLNMLQFELGWPGPMSFLRRISKADNYDLETRTLAKYFLEVTIMDDRFVGTPPSFIAAASYYFARTILKKTDWTPAHVYYSGYSLAQLKPLVTMIMECCEHPQKHHTAVFQKYTNRKYNRASIFVKNEIEKGFTLPSIQLPAPHQPLPEMKDLEVFTSDETGLHFTSIVQIHSLEHMISIFSKPDHGPVASWLRRKLRLNKLLNCTISLGIFVVLSSKEPSYDEAFVRK